MLAYMPDIYPDELIFSWLSRWIGHCSCSVITRSRTLSAEFATKFNKDVEAALCRQYSDIATFLWRHTMIPYYIRYMDAYARHVALSRLEHNGKIDIADYMLLNHATIRRIRYCSKCAIEDRLMFGECYYHRCHQLWDVSICVKHGCTLASTYITLASATLNPPDSTIPIVAAIDAPCNKRQVDYSNYVVTAFNDTDIDVCADYVECLHRLSARYTLWNSRLVDYDRIVRNLHEFYADCGICIPNAQFVQYVVDATRIDTRIILLLLFMKQAR